MPQGKRKCHYRLRRGKYGRRSHRIQWNLCRQTKRYGNKNQHAINQNPQSISVITQEELQTKRPATIKNALSYTPGVMTGNSGSSSIFDSVMIRGFNNVSQNIYLDGFEITRGYVCRQQSGSVFFTAGRSFCAVRPRCFMAKVTLAALFPASASVHKSSHCMNYNCRPATITNGKPNSISATLLMMKKHWLTA
jgi:hypothetical protein